MITKNEIKLIKSLKQKKYRNNHHMFVVEGEKMVEEMLSSKMKFNNLYATEDWGFPSNMNFDDFKLISNKELNQISSLTTPNKVIAILNQFDNKLDISNLENKISIILDSVKDPGNLGTIIRIADWFGIQDVVCSADCVDLYNPKVVQATMGSIFRVKVFYTELTEFLKKLKNETNLTIYGTLLNGENIYSKTLNKNAVIVFGNESEGISDKIIPFIDEKLLIPGFSEGGKIDSLNVAISTAIVCAEFKRK